MSTVSKWIIGILCLAALGWLVWWSGWLKKPATQTATDTTTQATTTAENNAPINGMSANNDASDTAIAQDTAAIDAQLKAYSTDSSDVDSSMNDKQVTQ
ncbi:MAG TPA: hypothetical protein VG984_01570 [Candidatus Paceibacterota bacterium]|nr:hypothetical protein [Candidatus Paceibacterota bacterium]